MEPGCSFCQAIGLTCNACSYHDHAGHIELEARPVNLFIEKSQSSQFRLLWILDSQVMVNAEELKEVVSAFD